MSVLNAIIKRHFGLFCYFNLHNNLSFRRNRGAQHELDKDMHDKFSAHTIDSRCHGLQNTSAGINYFAGIENVDNT